MLVLKCCQYVVDMGKIRLFKMISKNENDLRNVDTYIDMGYSELGQHSKTLTYCGRACRLINTDLQ